MFNSTLKIEGLSVDFFQRIPIDISKVIADIREPGKRKADFSKTINIPANRESNVLFEQAYAVNIDFQTFNPNKKLSGSYFVGTTEVIRGNVQLLSIPQDENTGTYQISISGKNADLFLAIGDSLLTDLDFSDLNHTLGYAAFSATPTLGVGYAYGYEDRGMNGVNGFNWNILHMKAAIFVLEYVKRIFASIGKTYTSNIISGSDFSHFTMPCNKEGAYQFNASQVDVRQFYAKKTTTQARNGGFVNGRSSPFPVGYQYFNFTSITPVIFNDDSTSPLFDTGGIYNTATGVYTTSNVIQSNLVFRLEYLVRLTIPATALATAVTFEGETNLQLCIRRNGIVVAQSSIQNPMLLTKSGSDMTGTLTNFVTYNTPFSDPIGTTYDCCVLPQTGAESSSGGTITNRSMFNGNFKDAGGSSVGTGSPAFPASTYTVTAAYFYSILSNRNLYWGDTIDMNTVVPEDIKQIDFLNWIIKRFHLFIEQDSTDPTGNNYIIEDRNNFYSTGPALNIDDLQDTSQDYIVTPMGELDAKTYLLTDIADQDYWNKKYQDKYKEIYGQYKYEVDNDFLQNEKRIETGFSPTPGVAFQTDIVAPRYLTIEGSFPGGVYTAKPTKVNPRILWYAGYKNCALHNLQFNAGSLTPNATNWKFPTSYPCMNHMDDPQFPTYDLNFAAPRELFYTLPAQQWTTNTRGNDHYDDFFEAISNPNSKIVEVPVMFTENHIYNFTFRRKIHFKGQDFYVNKLTGYDPQTQGPTTLELLKVPSPKAYISVVYNPNDPPTGTGRSAFTNPEYSNTGNYGNGNIGQNIVNGAKYGAVIGHDIQVNPSVNEVTIIGGAGYYGTEYDGKVVLRNYLISDAGIETDKLSRSVQTADFDITDPITFVDCTAGNIIARLPGIDSLLKFRIIRVDNTGNTLTVKGFTGFEDLKTTGASATSYLQPGQTTKEFSSNLTAWYY